MLRAMTMSGISLTFGAGLFCASTAMAGQIDSPSYFALRTGMTASEIRARVGAPDEVSFPGDEVIARRVATLLPSPDGGAALGVQSHAVVRAVERWHYIPDRSELDPHITVITLRGDRVAAIERIKVFSRAPLAPAANAPSVPSAAAPGSAPDHAERVLDAAREYAVIRARLKNGAQPTTAPATKIYRAPGGAYLAE